MVLSPDCQRLAIGYDDGLVRVVWSVEKGVPLKFLSGFPSGTNVKFEESVIELLGHTRSAISALAFTSDGRRLVSASDDGTARVWDTRVGEDADFAQGRWPGVEHLAYSPNCRIIATSVAKTAFDEKRIVFRDAASWPGAVTN